MNSDQVLSCETLFRLIERMLSSSLLAGPVSLGMKELTEKNWLFRGVCFCHSWLVSLIMADVHVGGLDPAHTKVCLSRSGNFELVREAKGLGYDCSFALLFVLLVVVVDYKAEGKFMVLLLLFIHPVGWILLKSAVGQAILNWSKVMVVSRWLQSKAKEQSQK